MIRHPEASIRHPWHETACVEGFAQRATTRHPGGGSQQRVAQGGGSRTTSDALANPLVNLQRWRKVAQRVKVSTHISGGVGGALPLIALTRARIRGHARPRGTTFTKSATCATQEASQ